ncbi:MAG: helix-turn-helix domain-containing protein [Oscillospiraceae bacterium]|nr:helix-turn-helix domain-containing protein [Oscillospiraceae bacterium]
MGNQDNYKKTIGERIKEARESTISQFPAKLTRSGKPARRRKAHLTQAELAELIGCEPNYINMLEHGNSLTFENACKIAKVTGVSPDYLLGKTENKHYTGDVLTAIADMQRYALMIDTLIEYIALSAGIENNLSEKESEAFWNDILWYAKARMTKMIQERGE